MTSMFDSNVRARREHTPWARVSLRAFLRDVVFNTTDDATPEECEEHAVQLSVRYRPSVSSRLWWVLSWRAADGQWHTVQSQDFDLLLWRAAEVELACDQVEEEKDASLS